MTNNSAHISEQEQRVVNRFQKMYLCYDEQHKTKDDIEGFVVNRFQKMYLCYDEQLIHILCQLIGCCESLSKNVSLL